MNVFHTFFSVPIVDFQQVNVSWLAQIKFRLNSSHVNITFLYPLEIKIRCGILLIQYAPLYAKLILKGKVFLIIREALI